MPSPADDRDMEPTITYYSQAQLALDYVRRTGASFTLARMLMDREERRFQEERPARPDAP